MRIRSILAAGAIGVLLLGTGIGIAEASIPDGAGVIHACYQNPPPAHGANLQVIDTGNGGSCGGGMASLTWNQTGPQGPAGPSTAGPSGLDTVVVSTFNAGPLGGSPATAKCPASHPYILGGGGYPTFPNGGIDITASLVESIPEYPNVPAGWDVTTSSQVDGAQVYAVCAK